MAAFLPVTVLLFLLVTGAIAGGYDSPTTPSPSTPTSSYTPTPATPTPPTPATPRKPAHGYDDDDNKKLLAAAVLVVVEGTVLCQSCAKRGLDGLAPLPKAQVMVTCRDGKHQVTAVADSNGYFHAEFTIERADDFWSKNPRGACFVRLLSSPDPKCKMASDIHLHDEGKHKIDGRGFRNIVYATRPLTFRPRKCALPHHH